MKLRIVSVALILIFLSLACNAPIGPEVEQTPTPNQLFTMMAGTFQVSPTAGAPGTATVTSAVAQVTPGAPTNTLAPPTNTPIPPTATPIPCDVASFIQDVTIPDNAKIPAGQTFTKTWRLRNVGTCTWNKYYAVVFINGDPMGAPDVINLTGDVPPNNDVDISIPMKAPGNPGTYVSNWKLRNPTGVIFGVSGNMSFFAQIQVVSQTLTPTITVTPTITRTPTITQTPTVTLTQPTGSQPGTVVDFVASMCKGEWRSEAGVLPCPGTKDDARGYAMSLTNPKLENGDTSLVPAMLTVPQAVDKGAITGRYPAVPIAAGYHFVASLGCLADVNQCSVIYQLNYIVNGGQPQNLQQWTQTYDGTIQAVDVDLSALAGKSVEFVLVVLAQGPAAQDQAVWVNPRIVQR